MRTRYKAGIWTVHSRTPSAVRTFKINTAGSQSRGLCSYQKPSGARALVDGGNQRPQGDPVRGRGHGAVHGQDWTGQESGPHHRPRGPDWKTCASSRAALNRNPPLFFGPGPLWWRTRLRSRAAAASKSASALWRSWMWRHLVARPQHSTSGWIDKGATRFHETGMHWSVCLTIKIIRELFFFLHFFPLLLFLSITICHPPPPPQPYCASKNKKLKLKNN